MLKLHRIPFFALSTAVLLGSVFSGAAFAQSQPDTAPSVAEAAKRAREQKKNATKPVRTLTNDNLPAASSAASSDIATPAPKTNADGTVPSAAPDASAPKAGTPGAAAKNEDAEKQKKVNLALLDGAKKQLASREHELDVLQRKLVLDSDAHFSKGDIAGDTAGQSTLDEDNQLIGEKKRSIEAVKAKIAELIALLGADAPAEPDKNAPPSPPAQ